MQAAAGSLCMLPRQLNLSAMREELKLGLQHQAAWTGMWSFNRVCGSSNSRQTLQAEVPGSSSSGAAGGGSTAVAFL